MTTPINNRIEAHHKKQYSAQQQPKMKYPHNPIVNDRFQLLPKIRITLLSLIPPQRNNSH